MGGCLGDGSGSRVYIACIYLFILVFLCFNLIAIIENDSSTPILDTSFEKEKKKDQINSSFIKSFSIL